jgi:hypothetical protein
MTYPIGTPLSEINPRGVVCSGASVSQNIMSRMGYHLNMIPQDQGQANPVTSQPEMPKASWAPILSA